MLEGPVVYTLSQPSLIALEPGQLYLFFYFVLFVCLLLFISSLFYFSKKEEGEEKKRVLSNDK